MTSENKYNRWVFTINDNDNEFGPSESDVQEYLKSISVEYGFQLEKATRCHYQGWFVSKIRKRQQTLVNEFSQWITSLDTEFSGTMVTINRMMGTVEQSIEYCSKSETRVGSYFTNRVTYAGLDLKVLDDISSWYPWQRDVYDIIFDENNQFKPGGRNIHWFKDPVGNHGKSLLVKYFCFNYPEIVKVSFGTAPQLRSSLTQLGARKVYIIDIPRTLAKEDSMASVINVLEDLLNGHLVSSFHGQYNSLMLEPPIVLVFSNASAPVRMSSVDRWMCYLITESYTLFKEDLI
jgi:hypothetical protein